jgi:hypothetical protein
MTLTFDTAIRLQIPENLQSEIWQRCQTVQGDRWQAYLNQICYETVRQWLTEKFGNVARPVEPVESLAFWEMVNGFALALAETRIVVIPAEAIDRLELRVPQEWVDIAIWIGDYYLVLEVDTDDQWIEIWGYTTHEQLKTVGVYDADDRSYSINSDALITDINVLWAMLEFGSEVTRAGVSDLSTLTEAQAENLTTRLSQTAIPRLEIPFGMWGSLIVNPQWRQQLGQSRQSVSPALSTNLSRWLQNQFEAGWQAIENLVNTPTAAFSFRQDEVTGTVERAKQLALTPEITVLLVVRLTPDDGRVAVQAGVLSAIAPLLPADLTLSLLSDTGEVLQSVQARQQDNSIQLRRFRCSAGTVFRLQIASEDGAAIAEEEFVV